MRTTSASLNSTVKSWLQLTATFAENGLAKKYSSDEPPLRAELFSGDQMKLHGKTLAASHQLSPVRPGDRLLTGWLRTKKS